MISLTQHIANNSTAIEAEALDRSARFNIPHDEALAQVLEGYAEAYDEELQAVRQGDDPRYDDMREVTERPADPFADLESDFDGGSSTSPAPAAVEHIEAPTLEDAYAKGTRATVARFPCSKCSGSGKFYSYTGRLVGPCRRCGGTGKVKTDPRVRAERAAKRERERLEAVGKNVTAFATNFPAEYKWLGEHAARFDFARSLFEAVGKFGCLTERQHAALTTCMEKDAARAKERAERKPDAEVGGAGFSRMVAAFDAAKVSGLRRPKFRVGEYTFAPAKASSANAGCIYVTRSSIYIGKITAEGAYFATREATAEDKAEVARIGADPLAAAVMHGKQTGACSCCGRTLENAESVELGIGPICRAKWGLK